MPDAIGSGLIGWLRRGNGAALLGLAALGWIGLLSWEMPAHGQMAGSGSAVSHLVGRLPAATADFLLQSFGLAAALVFAAPTFWGIEQVARQRLGRPFMRLALWPASVLAATGALSALPAPASWPFGRGLGGVVGDQLFALAKSALSMAGPELAAVLAAVAYGLVTLVLFGTAVSTAASEPTAARPETGAFRDMSFDGEAATQADRRVPDLDQTADANTDFVLVAESPAASAPTMRMAPPRKGRAPAFTRLTDEPSQVREIDLATVDPNRPIHVPYDDLPDDDESRRMAKRFAPGGERSDTVDSEPVGEPQPWIGWKQLLGRATDVVAPMAAAAAVAPVAWQAAAIPASAPPPVEERYAPEPPPEELATGSVRTWAEPATSYRVPSINMLARLPSQGAATAADNRELVARARQLEDVLAEFGVRCEIVGVVPGPIVTQFEIETAPGIKTTRVVGLAGDVARAIGVSSARVVPVPGRASINIELPNGRRGEVALRDLLVSRPYRQALKTLPVAIGVAVDHQPIVTDLAMLNGLLIAGKAGTGKSTALNAMLASLLLKFAPADLRLLVIDPKRVDHAQFDGIAHLIAPVITQPAAAQAALEWCVAEMDERLKAMAKLNLRGIGTYNNAVRNALRQGTGFKRAVQTGFDRATGRALYEEEIVTAKAMPAIVVVIDDLDVLMRAGGEGLGAAMQRLGRNASDAGIHVIAATGRLDSDSVPAGVRAALPARMTFKLDSKAESRSVIGEGGAEVLLGAGDFLFSVGGAAVRGQAPTLADGDLGKVCEAVRRQAPPSYEPALMAAPVAPVRHNDTEIYQQAVSLTMQHGTTSVAELRARLGVGYVAANDLLLRMQAAGLVGGEDDQAGRRRVLLSRAASA